MVGVGWLVVMDDWLLRGGALGALLGFAIGGALLFPIGWSTAGWWPRCRTPPAKSLHRAAFSRPSASPPMDDDARLFHRLPLGSRCRRPHRRLHRPALDSIEIYRIAGRRFIFRTSSSASASPHCSPR